MKTIVLTYRNGRLNEHWILTGLLLLVFFLLASCSKDIGNYDYEDANLVTINTTTDSFAVRQNDTLFIEVNLEQTQNSANLSYRWYMIQYVSTNPNPPQYELDSTKNLKMQVKVVPGLYKIVNRVTDNTTGVSFYKYFKINVLPAPWGGEGWLVLQDQSATQNGDDLSVILTRDGSTHGTIYHNLYFQANRRKLPAGTYMMRVHNYIHSLARQKVMFAYNGGGVEVKAIDFSDSSYAPNWFLNTPANIQIDNNSTLAGGQKDVLINNGQLQYRSINLPALAAPPILFGAPILGTWELSPHIMRYASITDNYVMLYDKKNRSFLSMNLTTNAMVPVRPDVANEHYLPYSGNPASLLPTGTGFDYNKMRHNLIAANNLNQVVGATSITPGTWNCFFRNDDMDSTWLVQVPVYLAYTNNNVTGRFYLNPTRVPGINTATLFANPTFLPAPGMFYYAKDNQVYTCSVSPVQGNSIASPGFTFPSGTIIKAMKVFESGYSGPDQAPRTPFPATEGRVLVVATDETASGGGNNVYFININNNGSLQTSFADKYTGFDKIVGIEFKKDVNL